MARKTVLVCDNCSNEIDEGKGASMRINYSDARRGSKQADLCDNCAGGMPGHAAARPGRPPQSLAADAAPRHLAPSGKIPLTAGPGLARRPHAARPGRQ